MAGSALSTVLIERAVPADAEAISRMLASMYDPAELPFTIWSSPRIDRYVADRMEDLRSDDAPYFGVLRRSGSVAGAIQLRTIDGGIFIDGIFTDPAARKEQLSNLLVHRSLKLYARVHGSRIVRFDAPDSKPAVQAWHRRVLGALEVERRTWWRIPLQHSGSGEFQLTGLAESNRVHERWGFSNLQVRTPRRSYTVGRLPGPYFRVGDPEAALDADLHRALTSLDPARELCVTGGAEWKPMGGRLIDAFVRSEVEFSELLRRLRSQIPDDLMARDS